MKWKARAEFAELRAAEQTAEINRLAGLLWSEAARASILERAAEHWKERAETAEARIADELPRRGEP